MRRARIIEEGGGYYHVMSRIVDRRMVIDDSEKGTLRYLMRGMEGFSGVEIVTYAILDNHFHILLYVPERQDVDDAELIRRLGCLYSKPLVKSAEKHLVLLRERGQDAAADEFKLTYSYRMYDLAQYMKTLKQRLSCISYYTSIVLTGISAVFGSFPVSGSSYIHPPWSLSLRCPTGKVPLARLFCTTLTQMPSLVATSLTLRQP